MYNEHQFLPHFLLILKPATIFHSLPFAWNKNTKQVENSVKTWIKKRIYKLQCNLHVLLTFSILVQVILSDNKNPSTKALSIFTVAMLTLTSTVVKEYSNKGQDSTLFLNRLIKSSKENQVSMDLYERNRKVAVDILNPGTFFFPLLYTIGVAWNSPCLPSNYGYWMLNECSNHNFNQSMATCVKIIFAAINFWVWSFGMHATVVVGSGIVMVASIHFRSKLREYYRNITTINSDMSKKARKYALLYRQIQLLSRQYNQLHQRAILIAIILSVVATQSICIYALVKFHKEMIWINKLFFGMMALDCFVSIIMLCGTLADTYDTSMKILRELNRRHRRFKWLSRFHRSCQAIKMRFGMTNFMEKLTPLNFQNFSICQTVNLLLMK